MDERLEELQPALDEYRKLLAVKAGLDGGAHVDLGELLASSALGPNGGIGTGGARRRAASPSLARRGRAAQAVDIIGAAPGITVKEIAAQMGIDPNYLYRLLPRMERDGTLKREGSGWALA